MKENAYLLNARQGICDALKQLHPSAINDPTRRDLIFALHELDAYRHGKLQTCEHCADITEQHYSKTKEFTP